MTYVGLFLFAPKKDPAGEKLPPGRFSIRILLEGETQ